MNLSDYTFVSTKKKYYSTQQLSLSDFYDTWLALRMSWMVAAAGALKMASFCFHTDQSILSTDTIFFCQNLLLLAEYHVYKHCGDVMYWHSQYPIPRNYCKL